MTRTQISFDPEVHRNARRRAGDLGISLAEYLRGLVARDLGQVVATADPSTVFNLGASGNSDIASNKDAMLAQAFEAERLPHIGTGTR